MKKRFAKSAIVCLTLFVTNCASSENDQCTQDCAEKLCGDDDGCGGRCTDCPAGQTCNQTTWRCEGCTPDCTGKQCGDSDGCGGRCTDCPAGQTCNTSIWACEGSCTPDCTGKSCGQDDGCAGRCTFCSSGQICNTTTWQCEATCQADCTNRHCGDDDGCGGRCTACPAGQTCHQTTWQCEGCIPDCQDKECGPDGCGGQCLPGCGPGQTCSDGHCQGCLFEPYGQDFNLTRRCARTVCDSSSPYFYEDRTECTSQSAWLVAVESEASLGASCPGPANCSFLINGPQSPVILEWLSHQGDCGQNWTVHMAVDHSTYPSPCPGDWWTWLAFMDHQQTGGGPYPPALETVTHHVLSFSFYTPTPDTSARVFAGGQWWWGGKARAIEFNFILHQWGDADPHPGLVVRFDTPEFEFIALDAAWWGMSIEAGQDVSVDMPWGQILQDAVSNGWLAAPPDWSQALPMAYFIGLEVKNRAAASLWHTDFRILHRP